MSKISSEELSLRLNKNGWSWCLISNLTPNMIRIQLSDDGEEETGWRKCIEAPTIEQAVEAAERFVLSINAYEYGSQIARWEDEDEA